MLPCLNYAFNLFLFQLSSKLKCNRSLCHLFLYRILQSRLLIFLQTFAEWGVDYLKLDGCYANPRKMDKGYPKFSRALNKTGRPIMFSCSWPAYQVYMNMTVSLLFTMSVK